MSSVILTGDTSGTLNLAAPLVAGTNTQTLVAATGTLAPLISGTAVSATGTSVNFTDIPSWVKRITVMFKGVSTNSTSNWLIRVGTSSGIATSGYLGAGSYNGASNSGANNTTGFIFNVAGAPQFMHGSMIITLQDQSTNSWVQQAILGDSSQAYTFLSGGSVTLSGTLDRVRITTVNGTDVFDAGSINILYE